MKQKKEIIDRLIYDTLNDSTYLTIICPDLPFYLEKARLIESSKRKEHPIKSRISDFLYPEGYIQFFLKGLILRKPDKEKLKRFFRLDGNMYWCFEQNGKSLIGVFSMSEPVSPDKDKLVEFSLKAKEGDLVNVLLSPLKFNQGLNYARIDQMHNAEKSEIII